MAIIPLNFARCTLPTHRNRQVKSSLYGTSSSRHIKNSQTDKPSPTMAQVPKGVNVADVQGVPAALDDAVPDSQVAVQADPVNFSRTVKSRGLLLKTSKYC